MNKLVLLILHFLFEIPLDNSTKKWTVFNTVNCRENTKLLEIKDIEKEKFLLRFAAHALHTNSLNIKIYKREQLEDLAESGGSAEIFIIKNLSDTPILVLKVDKSPSKERHALEYLNKKNLSVFKNANMLDSTYYKTSKCTYEVLALSYVRGNTVNNYFKMIGALPPSAEKRSLLFDELLEAIRLTSCSLAELHTSERKKIINPAYLKQQQKIMHAFSLPPIRDHGPIGLIHGDLNPGNIFYDHPTKILTFIDFETMADSFQGGPIAYDIAQFSLLMEALGHYYRLTEKEQVLLQKTFCSTYKRHGVPVADSIIDQYKHFLEMSYILGFSDVKDRINIDPQNIQAERLAEYFLQRIRVPSKHASNSHS